MTRRTLSTACALAATTLLAGTAGAQSRQAPTAPPQVQINPGHRPATVPGEILVGFHKGTSSSERGAARRSAKVAVRRALSLSGVQLVRTEDGQSVGAAISALRKSSHVRYAEPNHRRYKSATSPNDALFARLWGLHNSGQAINGIPGTADADIDAPEAWDLTTGSSGVVVAVADEGVYYDHPDLDGNMWRNPAEVNGSGGVDDDGNGHVDDIFGIDTSPDDSDGTNGPDADPRDRGGHGTHVAGTIAAEGNNAIGTAGVAWDARLMAVRVLGPSGGTDASVAEGFDYAGDMGADIVNASLGGEGFSSAIRDAIASHPGTLYVVAAGNEGVDNDNPTADNIGAPGGGPNGFPDRSYPCSYTDAEAPNMVCVGATDSDDAMAGFSNFGKVAVDLAAPGVEVLSTAPSRGDLVYQENFDGVTPPNVPSGFTRFVSGAGVPEWTSFATAGPSAPNVVTDSPSGNYVPNTATWLTRTTGVNLGTKQGCHGFFQMKLTVDTNKAYLGFNSVNPANFNQFLPVYQRAVSTGSSFELVNVDLAADFWGQPSNYMFEFEMGSISGAVAMDGAYVDDVKLGCVDSVFNPSAPSPYEFLQGTSMASPHVAGAAALALSLHPSLTPLQLKAVLLGSGDPVSALSTKTVTGRRLNVDTALRPLLETGDPSGITAAAATLAGSIDPRGGSASYSFEYGPTTSYGSQTLAQTSSGAGSRTVTSALAGLLAATTYHYRLVVTQDGVTYRGADRTLTTTAPPPPATPPTPPATPTVKPPVVDPVGTMARTAKVSCKRKRSRRTCKVTAKGATRVTISIKKGRRTLAKGSGRPGRTIKLKGRLMRGRRYRVTIVLTDAAGNKATIRRTFRL